ncbi:MAG: recombinase family protein [Pseudomonadota bacterium]
MKKVRYAIYTHKSGEEGLEQEFNSLDAQRDACEAYVLSQASEGWHLLPDIYDDGGISGGTFERPALQRLLADVADGRIDIIVIYKVDRLTRSLLDFAKLVEALDKAGTSFVSIAQSFNTTASMGRLTLNMLLSFAQFEREVIAERIRDKITASKARGMWMGGTPRLRYRPDGRTLAIIEDQAEIVRDIYRRYLALGNVRHVAEQLASKGIDTPQRTSGAGRNFGGCRFSRGQIYLILRNPIYVGDIPHRGQIHKGQHPPVIDRETWDRVQTLMTSHVQGGRRTRSPHASKDKIHYRYYISRSLQHGDTVGKASSGRLPARDRGGGCRAGGAVLR